MQNTQTRKSQALTDLILETFSLNGALLAAGDELVRDIGLTSARWQVLGAIALEQRPLTVAQIARRMGLSRQAVQRVVNELEVAGVLEFSDNPDHKRARLVSMTNKGERAYAKADERQTDWAQGLAAEASQQDILTAVGVLRSVNQRLSAGMDVQGA